MATQKIALLVHKGKEIAKKLNILGGQNGVGSQGKPVVIQAEAGAKYQLALEEENGLAPENIGVKRVGEDLHVAFEGGDVDAPDLIIEDYYDDDDGAAAYAEAANQELIGLHENGNMYNFVPESALPNEAIGVLAEGLEAPQVLGGALGAGPAAFALNPAIFAPLLGLAAAGGGGGGGGEAPAAAAAAAKPSAGKVDAPDNTNDNTPTITGTGATPNTTISVVITDSAGNSQTISITADANGNWSATPTTPLADGNYTAVATATDSAGNSSDPVNDNGSVDTVAPTANITQLMDNQNPQPLGTTGDQTIDNGKRTNDGTPLVSGTLSNPAEAGDKVSLYATVNGVTTKVGTYTATAGDTTWSVQDNTGYKHGDKVEYSVKVVDALGNQTAGSNTWAVEMDTQVITPDFSGVTRTATNTTFGFGYTTALPTEIAGFKLVSHLGQVITQKTTTDGGVAYDASFNDATITLANSSSPILANWQLGQSAVGYIYDDVGNVSGGDLGVTGGGITTGGQWSFNSTMVVVDDSSGSNVVLANNATTNDNQLTLSGKIENLTVTNFWRNDGGQAGNKDFAAAVYDNGNFIGLAEVDEADGSWTLNGYNAPDYVTGSSHQFTVKLIDKADGGITPDAIGTVNIDATVDSSKIKVNETMENGNSGDQLKLSVGGINNAVSAGQVLQIQGDTGDILDIGVASVDVGWIKTGTADGFGSTAAEQAVKYDVWQSYDGSNFTQVMVEQGIQVI